MIGVWHRLAWVACAALATLCAACAGDGDGGGGGAPGATPTATARPTSTAAPTVTPTPPPPPTLVPTASVTVTPDASRTQIVAHLDDRLGPVNMALLGVGWNTGVLEHISPFVPPSVRIDAHLDAVSPAPGELHLDQLRADVARVRALGAEPLVILFPMPVWLGEARAETCTSPVFGGPCRPENVAPSDLDAWEQVIEAVVRGLATAPQPARRFEVWNEPDLFRFWEDTREAFYVTAVHTHRAVARVAADTGLPIEIGGPGASYFEVRGVIEGTDEFMAGYVRAVVDSDLPLHFVSWHWYANYPRLGPDGPEGDVADEAYNLLAGINRIATPRSYTTLTERVRRTIAPILQPAGRTPALTIDEWNLSAGGYDLRHDSHVGAGFAAGALVEMERVGLDAANVYRSIPSSEHPGDWSIVELDGAKKPIWWVFHAWSQMTGDRLRVAGDDPAKGLWARATSANGEVHVLLATFVAVGGGPRAVRVELDGPCAAPTAALATLDETSSSFEAMRDLAVDNGVMAVDLAANAVAWIRVRCDAALTP